MDMLATSTDGQERLASGTPTTHQQLASGTTHQQHRKRIKIKTLIKKIFRKKRSHTNDANANEGNYQPTASHEYAYDDEYANGHELSNDSVSLDSSEMEMTPSASNVSLGTVNSNVQYVNFCEQSANSIVQVTSSNVQIANSDIQNANSSVLCANSSVHGANSNVQSTHSNIQSATSRVQSASCISHEVDLIDTNTAAQYENDINTAIEGSQLPHLDINTASEGSQLHHFDINTAIQGSQLPHLGDFHSSNCVPSSVSSNHSIADFSYNRDVYEQNRAGDRELRVNPTGSNECNSLPQILNNVRNRTPQSTETTNNSALQNSLDNSAPQSMEISGESSPQNSHSGHNSTPQGITEDILGLPDTIVYSVCIVAILWYQHLLVSVALLWFMNMIVCSSFYRNKNIHWIIKLKRLGMVAWVPVIIHTTLYVTSELGYTQQFLKMVLITAVIILVILGIIYVIVAYMMLQALTEVITVLFKGIGTVFGAVFAFGNFIDAIRNVTNPIRHPPRVSGNHGYTGSSNSRQGNMGTRGNSSLGNTRTRGNRSQGNTSTRSSISRIFSSSLSRSNQCSPGRVYSGPTLRGVTSGPSIRPSLSGANFRPAGGGRGCHCRCRGCVVM